MKAFKSIIVLIITLSLLAIPAVAFAMEFPDLPGDYWARREILEMANLKVILGAKDGNFYPEKPVTRAEFATMVVKGLGIPVGTVKKSRFNDVPNDHWALNFIEEAGKAGFISGYQGNFRPGDNISRQEMAVILMNISSKYGYSGDGSLSILIKYKDGNNVALWAKSAFAGALRYEYMSEVKNDNPVFGSGTGTSWSLRELKPALNATRAESAYAIYKMLLKTGVR